MNVAANVASCNVAANVVANVASCNLSVNVAANAALLRVAAQTANKKVDQICALHVPKDRQQIYLV